jgi:hypothetical protein
MNHTGLYILPSLFYYYTPDKNSIKYCWNNKYKNRSNRTLFNEPTDKQTKFTIGILNGRVWKSKFEEKSSNLSENSDESNNKNDKIIESGDDEKINEKTYEHLTSNSCMDTVHRLFQKATEPYEQEELIQNLIKWKIRTYLSKVELQFFKKINNANNEWDLIHTKIEDYSEYYGVINYYNLIASLLINNNEIIILSTFGIHIYNFSENDKSISLKYFYHINKDKYSLDYYKEVFSKPTLPLPNYDSYRSDEWVSYVKDNKSSLLNYGIGLLTFAIKEHKLELIDDIYKDCMTYFKEDLTNNRAFLSIITSTMPLLNEYHPEYISNEWASYVKDNKSSLLRYGTGLLTIAIKEHKLELIGDIYKNCMTFFKEDLTNNRAFISIITSTMSLLNEYYPEYISRFSIETTMTIDSPNYTIVHRSKNLHLHSFFLSLQIVNLSRSLLWTKYSYLIYRLLRGFERLKRFERTTVIVFMSSILLILFYITQVLIILLTLPLFLATFYILSKYHFINNIFSFEIFSLSYYYIFYEIYLKISKKFKNHKTGPTFTFMIPYIKFINYPQNYKWFLEIIKPQSSPFTETISKDIYKTWNGEALINFKWNTFGKYYYAMIWILFIALLGCFTATATIPQKYINEDVRNQLFIASIILGFIHLSFEVRQFIYNSTKWFYNFWNIFGNYKCLIIYFIVF